MLIKNLGVVMAAFLLSPVAMAEPCLKIGSASEWRGTATVRVFNSREPWDSRLSAQMVVKLSRSSNQIAFDLGQLEVPQVGLITPGQLELKVNDGVLQQALASGIVNVGFLGDDRFKFASHPNSDLTKLSRIDLQCETENKLVGFIMLESGVEDSSPLSMFGLQMWVQLERKLP